MLEQTLNMPPLSSKEHFIAYGNYVPDASLLALQNIVFVYGVRRVLGDREADKRAEDVRKNNSGLSPLDSDTSNSTMMFNAFYNQLTIKNSASASAIPRKVYAS